MAREGKMSSPLSYDTATHHEKGGVYLRRTFGELSKKRRNEETLKTCLRRVVEEVFIFVFGVL